jgi:ring-1,2-phenylacetyl-CoA epoxidase subunit PaaC
VDPHQQQSDDNPYLALTEVGDDSRWAFGGGFDDPLEGVDARVPDGLDAEALGEVCLALGDESLLLAQTLQRWCTHAPELEEEVTLANVALDLLGQTRMLYARAAAAAPARVPVLPDGSPVPPEDRLAFFRDAPDFKVAALVVTPDADFAGLVLRLAAVASWRDALWRVLRASPDPVLSAVAHRAVAEVGYHRDVATRWVRVLAGGTQESARRLADAHRVTAPLVAALGARPAGAAGDQGWSEAWSRASARFDREWAAFLADVGLPAAPGRPGRPDPDGPDDADDAHVEPWRTVLVEEMQSVARQHPRGRW